MSEYSVNAPMTDEEIPLEVRNTLPEEIFRLQLEADCRAFGFDRYCINSAHELGACCF